VKPFFSSTDERFQTFLVFEGELGGEAAGDGGLGMEIGDFFELFQK